MTTKYKDKKIEDSKILIAPHEIGGQMKLMASKFRDRGYFATSMCYHQNWHKYISDIQINLQSDLSWFKKQKAKLLFTMWAANNFDIFHFFWGQSLFGTRFHPHLDLLLLKKLKKKIFVHFRGIDIVDVKYFDYLRDKTDNPDAIEPPFSRADQIQSVNIWRKYANKMLVSEPDLFRVVPDAIMVQQTIDMQYWKTDRLPKSDDGKIRILHAPTMRRKKGTEIIESVVDDLISEGMDIELVLVENVPSDQVKDIYDTCDIAIDQMLYGWHGKFSVELMCMKKPVLCYIDPNYGKYRLDLPIINVNYSNLKSTIIDLVNDKNKRNNLGELGYEYVKKYHDINAIIDQCINIYQEH